MAGIKNIWVSSTMVSPTNDTGEITGFGNTRWFKIETFQNRSQFTSVAGVGRGGIQWESTVTFRVNNLNESALKFTNELAMSYGFSIVLETANGKGIYPSDNQWNTEYLSSDSGQTINFQSTSGDRMRFLTPEFFNTFRGISNTPGVPSNVITINTSPLTIGGQEITIM